jgi:glycosyltransferase involved in cell wall biosynthesis
MTSDQTELLSVIIPVYNERESIDEVYIKLSQALSFLKLNYEIVFVDDSSIDGSTEMIKNIVGQDKRVKIVRLVKNSGQAYALLAGFAFSSGEIIVTLDADLQNDPQEISRFLAKINAGFDLVGGWRYNRKDHFYRRVVSFLANLLIWARSGIRLRDYGCAMIAVRRNLAVRLKEYGRNGRFIKPLLANLAGSFSEIKVRHYLRKNGVSKYSFLKIMANGIDFLLNFRLRPGKNSNLPIG